MSIPAVAEYGSFSETIGYLRPPPEVSAEFYAKAWWRHETVLHDVYGTAAIDHARPAFVLWQAAERRRLTVTYGQLVRHIDRFAWALLSLGVRPGDPVAIQLPTRWEAPAVILACQRMGAVPVPISTTIRRRELEVVLRETQARMCLVPDSWDGFPHAEALAGMAERLPWLRHRVVVGDAAATGAIDFIEYFMRQPHEDRTGSGPARLTLDEPDRVSLVVFTAGTTGEAKGVLHSHNTFASATGRHAPESERGWGAREVFGTPYGICDTMVLMYGVWGPLLSGGTGVLTDRWDPDVMLDLVDAAGVTQFAAAPPQWAELVAAQRERPRSLATLRLLLTTGSPIPAPLAEEIRSVFGLPLQVVWATTELGMGIRSRPGDPPEAVSRGEGAVIPGLQIDLEPVGKPTNGIYRLSGRGPSMCLGTWRRGEASPQVSWEHEPPWLDTGDLVARVEPDRLRVVGREADRIGTSHMIPVNEVEAELMRYPAIQEVAVISYLDPHNGELPCAVIVPNGTPPTLTELRDYLTWLGMTDWYQPARLELIGQLPRNHAGKVRKDLLRRWLADARG
ncbi:MAG TPA: AMP-binding protein [Actinoplanes sp.]|jgi:cyclohexanecarboxylate-CoA ligase